MCFRELINTPAQFFTWGTRTVGWRQDMEASLRFTNRHLNRHPDFLDVGCFWMFWFNPFQRETFTATDRENQTCGDLLTIQPGPPAIAPVEELCSLQGHPLAVCHLVWVQFSVRTEEEGGVDLLCGSGVVQPLLQPFQRNELILFTYKEGVVIFLNGPLP